MLLLLHISQSHARNSMQARVHMFCRIKFENHIYVKILAKFDFCLHLNYDNMLTLFPDRSAILLHLLTSPLLANPG